MNSEALKAYKAHKARAKKRGIEFLLSFEQWWGLWEPHWDKRGSRALEMCMCRKYDEGAYVLGNVRIATNKENHHERAMMGRIKRVPKKYKAQQPQGPLDKGSLGWLFGASRSEPESWMRRAQK